MPLFVGDKDGWSVFDPGSSDSRREPKNGESTVDTFGGSNVDPGATSSDYGAFYEPWVPHVGQRVRITISAECQLSHKEDSIAVAEGWPAGHADFEDGKTGYIIDPMYVRMIYPTWPEVPSHRFMVHWDIPVPVKSGRIATCSSYAASELVPLGDQP